VWASCSLRSLDVAHATPQPQALCSFDFHLSRSARIEVEVNIMATAKDELARMLEKQPEDASPEQIVRELAFHVMVQRGLVDSGAGNTISNEEMQHRIRSWQS
jgi:hypothetical protein